MWATVVGLGAIALLAASISEIDQVAGQTPLRSLALQSIAGALFGSLATVLTLESLRRYRQERKSREALVGSLRSSDPAIVQQGIEELRATGRLTTGYLDRADMRGASFRDADIQRMRAVGARLDGADLSGADAYRADLRHASLFDISLSEKTNLAACDLRGAKLLKSDIRLVRRLGGRV